MTTQEITIHTDGSCIGNPGPGGWAAIVRRYQDGEEIKKRAIHGHAQDTTNNRMELVAAINALKQIRRDEPNAITVYSDSEYLILGMNGRVEKWEAKGWRTAGGKPIQNQDLWQGLATIAKGLDVHWRWVKGHNANPQNVEADDLARNAARRRCRSSNTTA